MLGRLREALQAEPDELRRLGIDDTETDMVRRRCDGDGVYSRDTGRGNSREGVSVQ